MAKRKKSKKAGAEANAPAPAPVKKSPAMLITVMVVVVLVVVAVIAMSNANRLEVVDGKVSRIMATVDECAFATLTLNVPPDEPVEVVAETVFDALSRGVGIGRVTVHEQPSMVEIDYCQSYTSEPQLRELLAATGYLAP